MPNSIIIKRWKKEIEKIIEINWIIWFLYLREVVVRYQNRFRQFHRKLDLVCHTRLDHKMMQSSRHCYSWGVVQHFGLLQMTGNFCRKNRNTVALIISTAVILYLQFSAKLFWHIKIVWLLSIRRLLFCTPIIIIISISGHCMCLKYLFNFKHFKSIVSSAL